MLSYSVDLRERVVSYVRRGGSEPPPIKCRWPE